MKLVAVFLVALFVCSSAVAEEAKPKAGRLSSGKAYRVDADGFQLVDELAELEVTNHDLQRQLAALEEELAQKNRQIEDLKKGKNIAATAVEESDLMKSAAPRLQAMPAAKTISPAREIELTREIEKLQRQIKSIEVANWNIDAERKEMQSLKEQIAKQQIEIDSRNEQLAQLQNKLSDQLAAQTLKSQIATQQAEIQAKNSQLARLQESLSEVQSQLGQKSSIAQELDRQRNVNAQVAKEVEALRAQLQGYAALEKSQQEEQAKFAALTAENSKLKEQYAQLEKQNREAKQFALSKPEASYQRASLAPAAAAMPAVSNVVKSVDGVNISKQLAAVQSLISNRKHLLDAHKARGGGVSVNVQPLVAKNGQSLDQLRAISGKLSSQEEAKAVSKSIAEITAVLNEDIALLTRLASLR